VVTRFVSAKGLTREEYDAECTGLLMGAGAEYLVLVGYMRVLSDGFCGEWKGRCVNVHPSRLPLHAGGMDLAVRSVVCFSFVCFSLSLSLLDCVGTN